MAGVRLGIPKKKFTLASHKSPKITFSGNHEKETEEIPLPIPSLASSLGSFITHIQIPWHQLTSYSVMTCTFLTQPIFALIFVIIDASKCYLLTFV